MAKLDLIRQRVQQPTLGRRGHIGDPLYGIRRVARTRIQLLSARQYARLTGVFDTDEHLAVAGATYGFAAACRTAGAGFCPGR